MANYQRSLLNKLAGADDPDLGLNPMEAGGFTGGTGIVAPPAPGEIPTGPTSPPIQPEPRPIISSLGGYDPSKLNAEHAKKSPKYAFGLMAQEYADTPEGLIAMSQDPRFAASGFQLSGKDKILAPDPDRGGALGTVDVGNSFSIGGGKGWQWGAEPGSSGGPTAAASGGMTIPKTSQPALQDLYAGSGQDAITKGVEQYSQPSPYLAALLKQLGVG